MIYEFYNISDKKWTVINFQKRAVLKKNSNENIKKVLSYIIKMETIISPTLNSLGSQISKQTPFCSFIFKYKWGQKCQINMNAPEWLDSRLIAIVKRLAHYFQLLYKASI